MPVASAAPATPHCNTATNSASNTAFVQPAAIVTARPILGFSAAAKKLWKMFCNMNALVNAMVILPYVTQCSIMPSLAPSNFAMGSTKISPNMVKDSPRMTANRMIMEKTRLAFSLSFSPMILETSAVPPVPNMNPTPPNTMMKG